MKATIEGVYIGMIDGFAVMQQGDEISVAPYELSADAARALEPLQGEYVVLVCSVDFNYGAILDVQKSAYKTP